MYKTQKAQRGELAHVRTEADKDRHHMEDEDTEQQAVQASPNTIGLEGTNHLIVNFKVHNIAAQVQLRLVNAYYYPLR